MRLLVTFARVYPSQTIVVLFALLLAGFVEGVSLTALLPMVSTLMQKGHVVAAPATSSPSIPSKQGGSVAESTPALGPDTELESGENAAGEDWASGQMVVDILERVGLEPTLGIFIVILLVGTVLRSAIVLMAKKQVGYTMARVATDLRLKVLKALMHARWEYYVRQPLGIFASAVSFEASRASNAYLYGANAMATLIQLVAYTVVAVMVSWEATVAYLGVGGIILYVLHYFVRIAKRAGKRQTKLMQSLLKRLTDSLQSVKPLKAMGRENLADAILSTETRDLNKALKRQVYSKEALRAVQYSLFAALVATGFYVGLEQWNLPTATVIVMVVLLARVLNSLGKVQSQYQDMVSAESAYWALARTVEEAQREQEITSGTLPPRLEREISLEHVVFDYAGKQVLEDLSLTIPAGSLTTLIGPSGAGKTTIVDLVIGLLRPRQGQVLIDGVSLADLDLLAWRHVIGYVPQENLLLHDSIYHNVTLEDTALSEADAEAALRAAGAWEFVAAMPEGMHSMAGERGTQLSGGQRQRIMIARALVHRPKLLIMDEATSALDPASEAAVCKTMQTLRGQLTILAISHQPTLVRAADRVYRLGGGGAVLEIEREDAELQCEVWQKK